MAEHDNTNRGAIWGNTEKREGKQDPDFKGSGNLEGRGFWISGWKRKPDASPKAPALSLTFKPKDGKSEAVTVEIDDDIPF